jgi:hypothetical protein
MADDGHALGQLTSKLGHEGQADEEEFSSLVCNRNPSSTATAAT